MTATRTILLPLLLLCGLTASAQRTYTSASVLSTGTWYQISVDAPGVYKIDLALLNSLGLSGNIPSSGIRLFGNGGTMLPEANSAKPADDLSENALWIADGGDGVLNGSDYILFYANGPDAWMKDSANRRFTHQKNLYSDRSFYYLTVGSNGLRIPDAAALPPAALSVTSFDERYFHELDTVNLLSSGREWYGEEFSNAPGRTLSRSFTLPLSDLIAGPAVLSTAVAARSVNVVSRFTVSLNNVPVQQIPVNNITTALYDLFAQQAVQTDVVNLNASTASVTLQYTQGSFNSQGWLNWFELNCRRNLVLPAARQLLFRDWSSVGTGSAQFVVSGADAATQVWDVTDPLHPLRMSGTLSGNSYRFTQTTERLREYVAFSNTFLTPRAVGRIANQNLHGTSEKDLIIITAPPFRAEAQRLAGFHQQHDGLRTVVVTTDEVFHEFASGTPDPTALRDFVKMLYDRNTATWNSGGKYLLLLGRASFDYKNRITGNTNLVPAYESPSSLDPLTTYTSDDFFGFLEDGEDINSGVVVNTLDIGIGRIPARTLEEARNFSDKLADYHDGSAMGPWRNNLNFIADDEDNNLHLQDAETMTATVTATAPVFNPQKIYLDAYHQESGSAGGRYPQANAAINSNIYNGTLLWNFTGHGGPLRLAEEVVIDQSIVNSWSNRYKLPLFITATCDFAPYDNPIQASLGENLLVRPKTGAIALMTTTRVVFAFSNRLMNNNYLRFAFERLPGGQYRTLGQAVQAAKNYTYQNSADVANNRKFTLLGDPAMTLAFPDGQAVVTRVNGKDLSSGADTLSAGETVLIEGEVRDRTAALIPGFNGRAYLSLFDKLQQVTTQGNDPASSPVPFLTQENSLFRGKATVQNGHFSFRFRMPRDMNYQYGNGKISLYAEDGLRDGNGYTSQVLIGGISSGAANDNEGPRIQAYLNDEKFVNGGIANASPVLLVKLSDSSGINTGSSGVDHDIVATLDGNNNQYFILNNFFETDQDDYQKGSLRFQLPALDPGPHSLKIKAWDVMNNSSEYVLDFSVINTAELRIARVLNYPNPFTTHTSFWFEHNYPSADLQVRVEIFTVSGKLINTLARTINTPGNRSSEIEWDGRDAYGSRVAQGVYIYRLSVRTPDGKRAEKWERLVLLGK